MVLYQDLSVSAGGATGGLYLSAVSGRIRKLSVQRFERRIPHPLIILILSAKHIKTDYLSDAYQTISVRYKTNIMQNRAFLLAPLPASVDGADAERHKYQNIISSISADL